MAICLNSHCCLCPPDSASRNGTKRKQPADGQRSGAIAKRREVKRSRTGRTQALNFEWRRQSAVFSRFRRNQRRSLVLKIAVCRRSNRSLTASSDKTLMCWTIPLPLLTSARFCGVERASSRGIRGDVQPVKRSKPRVGHGKTRIYSVT
jgi:hypothetical protein